MALRHGVIFGDWRRIGGVVNDSGRSNRLWAPLRLCVQLGLLIGIAVLTAAAAPPQSSSTAAANALSPGEQRAIAAFDRAKAAPDNALALEAFLHRMPKGGELHMHLAGAIYAETFIRDAAADGLCVNRATLSLIKGGSPGSPCADGTVAAASAFKDQKLYDAMVDAFSMRAFVPSSGIDGHDQFFATFDRFAAIPPSHSGEWLDEVATRAAAQNEQYLEVMMTPSFFELAPLWNKLGWLPTPAGAAVDPQGDTTGTSSAELDALRSQLLAGGLRRGVELDVKELDDALATRDRIEHCGQPNAVAACSVKIRVLYQVLRAFPPQQVFAQTLLGFEVALAEPRVVGINFVQPEDAALAMSEYNRQMHMLDYLHGVYPRVHISLHAGELAPGMVPPNGLAFHIREAVDVGHAERIGHAVDVMYEEEPRALLTEMADRHVMVELNLTSNDVILGVVPPFHPLPEYRAAGVPFALSTDDEGVSRIDLTHEYVRAAREYGLGYMDLKASARTAIEHSFLPGEDLWLKPDAFTRVKPACAGQVPGKGVPTADCLALLKSSERAAEQWELEHRFTVFEAELH